MCYESYSRNSLLRDSQEEFRVYYLHCWVIHCLSTSRNRRNLYCLDMLVRLVLCSINFIFEYPLKILKIAMMSYFYQILFLILRNQPNRPRILLEYILQLLITKLYLKVIINAIQSNQLVILYSMKIHASNENILIIIFIF